MAPRTKAPQELTIEQWPVAKLLRYANNSRDHSDAQVEQIAASIKEFGFVNPCLIDAKGVLIAGHGRVAGAQKLGLETVPVIRLGHLTDTQARALRIADNAIALNSTWNLPALKIELEALKLADYPIELVGFDNIQLVEFMSGVPTGKDPEATPEPPAMPVSKRGDVWTLGNHRMMCGDATSPEDVERLLDGAKPHLMVTDPPYGVGYDPSWRNDLSRPRTPGREAYAALGEVTNDDRSDWRLAWQLFNGDVAYVWSAPGPLQIVAYEALSAAGFEPRYQIIWAKPQFALGRGDYHWRHEPCWYAIRKGARSRWNGARDQNTVWDIVSGVGFTTKKDGPDGRTGHSTQKPLECMKRPIENNSQPGDAVYEPFSGSFTTGIACEITGRRCYAMEVSPQYVDMGILRWQGMTSKEARLDAPGSPTYAEVQADRSKPSRKRKRERTAA